MIAGLDGIRAIAFLMVFFFHSRKLMPVGWMGVQLFFVLSGFLITDILLKMKDKLPQREYYIKFYGRRFLRIFPLYYFYLALLAGLFFFNVLEGLDIKPRLWKVFPEQIWVSLFYVYDFFHASIGFKRSYFFTHLWSLSVEEQFYLVWPLLIYLTPRKWFKQLSLYAIGFGFIARLVISLIYRMHLFPFLLDDPQMAVYVLPFSQLDAFAFGAYISRFEIPRPRLQLLLLAIATPVLGTLSDLLSMGTVTSALGYDLPLLGFYKEVWGYTVLNYLFALLIYSVARTKFLTGFLELPPMRYLGKISYGLYIYHFGILTISEAIYIKMGWDYSMRDPQLFIPALGATVLIATISFYLLEKPIINLKDRFFAAS